MSLFTIILYCMVCRPTFYICLQVLLSIMPLFTINLYCMVGYICMQNNVLIMPEVCYICCRLCFS